MMHGAVQFVSYFLFLLLENLSLNPMFCMRQSVHISNHAEALRHIIHGKEIA